MRLIVFCLGLLLATPAAANSVEDALCGPASAPVARMDSSEKLCRATVRSFSELPAATHAELGALLSRDCAEFALGYQALFPKGQPFLLFDEGYNRSIELRPETTIENIIGALHDAPRT